ncbi:MAG: ABC transporter ATP-binding protein [Candidatus Helarchaeota archaeon]|nr:ABC transporter ATP-binding protein [Candidatus Helarchaeota archaeon]
MKIIHCQNLWFSYDGLTDVLKDINIKIRDGEFLGLMGENGAGKTTLVKLINGLLKSSRGEIFVNTKNVITLSVAELAHIIGFVFQNSDHQIFSRTVEEEVGFILKNFGYEEPEIKDQVQKILNDFNLEQYKDQSPFLLSGGERKKVALASILCAEPEILIFDEPTIGQDANEKRKLMKLLHELNKNGVTIIIITHDIEFTAEYIPRCMLLSKGVIIADGPTKYLLANENILREASLIEPQLAQLGDLLQFRNEVLTLEEIKNKILEFIQR